MFLNTALVVLRFRKNCCWRILSNLRTLSQVQVRQITANRESPMTFHHCDSKTKSDSPCGKWPAKSSILVKSSVCLTGLCYITRACSSSNEIIAFINTQDDFDKFFNQLVSLLQSDEARKFWVPKSKEALNILCHNLLEKHCDCMNLYSFFKDNPDVLRTEQGSLHYVIQYLYDLGLRSNQILYVLDKRPSLWKLKAEALQERVQQLWNLGLTDGQLMKAIMSSPEILSTKKRRFQSVLELLRRLQFTSNNIRQVITDSPQIFEEDEYQTELRLQYILFKMGVTDYKEIMKAKIFNYSHEHIRLRHLVLERLGLYQVPDKHGRTKIRNPSLCRIVDSTDKRFSSTCAGVSLEEFNAFSEMLKEEIAENEEAEWSSGDEEEEETGLDNDEDGESRMDDNEGQDNIR